MLVRATKDFLAKGTKVEVGSVFDIPENILTKLGGLVEVFPRHLHDKPVDTWCVEPRAWLCGDELRTTGVFDDLAAEIVKITSDDHELQRRLLIEYCQTYGPAHIHQLFEAWKERAAILQHDAGMSKERAEEEAARRHNLLAFLSEIRSSRHS